MLTHQFQTHIIITAGFAAPVSSLPGRQLLDYLLPRDTFAFNLSKDNAGNFTSSLQLHCDKESYNLCFFLFFRLSSDPPAYKSTMG
jgi:hypothetical protein